MNVWRKIDALWFAIGVMLIVLGVHLYCRTRADEDDASPRLVRKLDPGSAAGLRVQE